MTDEERVDERLTELPSVDLLDAGAFKIMNLTRACGVRLTALSLPTIYSMLANIVFNEWSSRKPHGEVCTWVDLYSDRYKGDFMLEFAETVSEDGVLEMKVRFKHRFKGDESYNILFEDAVKRIHLGLDGDVAVSTKKGIDLVVKQSQIVENAFQQSTIEQYGSIDSA